MSECWKEGVKRWNLQNLELLFKRAAVSRQRRSHAAEIMDYVFSHFLGIFVAASAAVVLYSGVLGDRHGYRVK